MKIITEISGCRERFIFRPAFELTKYASLCFSEYNLCLSRLTNGKQVEATCSPEFADKQLV